MIGWITAHIHADALALRRALAIMSDGTAVGIAWTAYALFDIDIFIAIGVPVDFGVGVGVPIGVPVVLDVAVSDDIPINVGLDVRIAADIGVSVRISVGPATSCAGPDDRHPDECADRDDPERRPKKHLTPFAPIHHGTPNRTAPTSSTSGDDGGSRPRDRHTTFRKKVQ